MTEPGGSNYLAVQFTKYQSMFFVWVVTPGGLRGRSTFLAETYCLHLQGVTTQKTNTDTFTVMTTSNLTYQISVSLWNGKMNKAESKLN